MPNDTIDSEASAYSNLYLPPCDRYGTGSAKFWWCVYQDLVVNAMPSALEYIYYPRTSPTYYVTTCSVLGYPTSTAMYYAMTVPPTSITTQEPTYSQIGTETTNDQSFDVSSSPSSGAPELRTLYGHNDCGLLSLAICIIPATLALILAL